MRLFRIFAIAIFMSIVGQALPPAQEAQAAPVAASTLGQQVAPASLQPTKVWWRRHYWHRHYWHRHYWHRHYWRRHYYW